MALYLGGRYASDLVLACCFAMVTSRVQSIKPPGEGAEAASKWIAARLGELAFISESHDRHGDCREDFGTLADIPTYTRSVTVSAGATEVAPQLRCGIVLHVEEDACQVLSGDQVVSVRYALHFPAPRTERVSPGHLVAIAEVPGGADIVVWRWYDAVVLDDETESVRLWEPAHGEVVAQRRRPQEHYYPGTRAYLSAGLPGAEWWVAGRAADRAEDADVELNEVERFYTEHGLWDSAQP